MTKSYKEVLRQIENLKKEAEQIRQAEIASAVAEVKTIMAEHGLTAADLGFGGKRKARGTAVPKVKVVKYRSDTNPEDTYAGRGPLPAWLKDKMAQGRNKEDFKV